MVRIGYARRASLIQTPCLDPAVERHGESEFAPRVPGIHEVPDQNAHRLVWGVGSLKRVRIVPRVVARVARKHSRTQIVAPNVGLVQIVLHGSSGEPVNDAWYH